MRIFVFHKYPSSERVGLTLYLEAEVSIISDSLGSLFYHLYLDVVGVSQVYRR